MKYRNMSSWMVLLVVGVFITLMSGCGSEDGASVGPNPLGPPFPSGGPKALTLASYASCSEMEVEIKDLLKADMEGNLEALKDNCRSSWGDDDILIAPSPENQSGTSQTTFTETNVQEKGVDESDLVKTDGTYVYAIIGDDVKIIRVWPVADFTEVAKVDPKAKPAGLYLSGEKLIVVSKVDESYLPTGNGSTGKVNASVNVEVFNVRDIKSPILEREFTHNGEYVDSRMVGSKIHLILNDSVNLPALDYSIDYNILPECSSGEKVAPTEAVLSAIDALRRKNLALIEAARLDGMVAYASGGEGKCRSTMRSQASLGSSIFSLVTDDVSSEGGTNEVMVLGNGGTVYTSTNNIFVASRYNPFATVFSTESFEDKTVLHRFSIEVRKPIYVGSADVKGHLFGNSYVGSRYSERFSMAQFAMSEYGSHLRIATTVGQAESFVSTLSLTGTGIEKKGEVGGIGKGEKIYAVRFIRELGYVVTFKKTDPLYVVDVSNPASPVVTGELKVPGFSTYLHPYDERRLIGFGFDGDDMGGFAWTQGLKLSMFDVSNPTAPAELGVELLGSRGSYSAAVEEHHAFTFDATRGMLALPITMCEGASGGSDVGKYSYSGVILYNVGADGSFEEKGEIKLNQGAQNTYCSLYMPVPFQVLRTIIIGDGASEAVVTLASDGVHMNMIDEEMSEVGYVN